MVLALITGGSGHVGSNLTRELIKQGYNVRCIDFDKDHRAFEGLDVELMQGDITDRDSLNHIFNGVDISPTNILRNILDNKRYNIIKDHLN